jgi:radical SAM/Cys-rich protein
MIAFIAGPPAHLWNSSGLYKTNRHSPSTVRPKSLSTDEKSSLIPQTLEELDADLELQSLHRQIAQQGQVQLTKQEEKSRLRSLARLGSPSFELTCQQHLVSPLVRGETTVLQLDIGLYCNQACRHCHVESSPRRTELMSEEVAKRCVELIDASDCIKTLDLTGGAPELCPQFRYLVEQGAQRGLEVIDRCNLTVLEEPGQEDLGEFLAHHGVRVVASLPCYTAEVVDAQRGRGVQGRSIRALKRLNSLGYGLPGSPLRLDLVYNPDGVFLAPSQQKLEAAYRQELWEAHGIQFSSLLCLNNMPIKRWADELIRK